MDASLTGDDSLDPNSGLAQALMRSPTYINPAYITPEQMAALRLMADKQQTSPEAKSWTGALGQTLQAMAAQQTLGRAASLDQLRLAAGNRTIANPNGGAAPASASGASASSAGSVDPQGLVSAYAPQLGAAGAAGLVGGFGAESGYSPTASGDGGHAIGIAQWNDRAPALKAYAAKYGKSPTDPEIQKRFPLVEMGLAGDPSDPGFGTERAAGQALKGARTPQEATAAALMYERPRGYSAAHPENSNAYGKRLALAAALMGGQGGAGASPTAYAPSAGNAGGMPPVGPGAGRAVPLGAGGGAGAGPMAAGPYQAPAGPAVVAQNAPMMGLTPQGYANVMTHQGIPDMAKRLATEVQVPQQVGIPGGGTGFAQPGQPALGTRTAAQGVLQGSAAAGNASAPTFTGVGPGGVKGTQFGLPGQGGSGQGLNALDPLAAKGRDLESQSRELQGQTEAVLDLQKEGRSASAKLGQLDSLRALGDQVETGAWPMIQNFAAKFGVPLGDDTPLGRTQAYAAMAASMLPSFGLDPQADAFRERLPGLSGMKEGRRIIADWIGNFLNLQKQRGDIALGSGTAQERVTKAAALRTKTLSLPDVPGAASKPTAADTAGAAPVPLTAAEKAESLANARAWIAKNPKDRDRVIKKLQGAGIDPAGL